MIERPVDSITKHDIEALLKDAVSEGRKIEYKSQLPGNADDDKRELLKDVSAFANSAGGDLIFGIQEGRDADGKPTGIPVAAHGVNVNVDAETLRIESIIRDGIAPRLAGVRMRAIEGFSDGPVILLRIQKSLAGPHQVTFRNLSRFFGRTSAGTYQLDVDEIGFAYRASTDYTSKIRDFRKSRLESLKYGETPMQVQSGPKYILHLFPLSATDESATVDIQRVAHRELLIRPMNSGGWNIRMNLDGCLAHDSDGDRPCATYAQLYRNGVIELVESRMFRSRSGEVDGLIPSELIERATVETVRQNLKVLAELGIEAPILVLAAMTGVKGFTLSGRHSAFPDECRYIDRDDLVLPDVLCDSMEPNIPDLLRPIFDSIWQAAGFPESLNYTADGVWNLRSF